MRIIRAGEHIQHIPGYGISVRESGVAVVSNWWEVAGKTCVAAYQPKGAASYAASKVNLANPGTYDATEGVAPTWAAETGWTFNGSSQYLTTGILPVINTWSVLCRYADATYDGRQRAPFGYIESSTKRWTVAVVSYARYYQNGGFSAVSGAMPTTGILGFAGNQGYLDGSADGGAIPAGTAGALTVGIDLGRRLEVDHSTAWWIGDVMALVIYSSTLTAGEVATVSAAMAAL